MHRTQWSVVPCEEADCLQLARITWKCFENSEINQYTRPEHLRPLFTDDQKDEQLGTYWARWVKDPKLYCMKAVDPERPQVVVGYTRWIVSGQPEEVAKQAVETVQAPIADPKVDREASERFGNALKESAKKLMQGRKYLNLLSLATHPDYQRQGVAGTLVQWGIDRAITEKLPLLIESVPQAKQVYASKGLLHQGDFTIDYEVKNQQGKLTGETKTLRLHNMIKEL